MQLRAKHRRQVVEEILDIEIFSKLNLMFREKAKTQDETIKQADFNYQLLDGKIETQQKHIDDISNTNKDTADTKKLDIENANTDIENYKEDIARVRREIAELQVEIIDETKLKGKHGKLTTMEAKIENTCIKHKKELRFFKEHDDCPTCRQAIDEAFKKATIVVKEAKVVELELGMKQLDNAIRTSQKKLDKINEVIVTIREKELLISRYETSITEIEKYKTRIQKEIDELSDEKFSTGVATGELNQLQDQLVDAEKDKIKQKEEKLYIDTARHLMQDTGIKTKIIKQYLPVMNQYINKNLADMDFFVNFTLDEEFNETIKSRHRDDFQYHSFSEGEKLRIDLAILFTWREIAKLKNSTNTNLLILDEIFDSSLDTSGTDEFMRILYHTMNKENVFVISHKGDTLIDKFPRVMKFEKYKNFTRMAE